LNPAKPLKLLFDEAWEPQNFGKSHVQQILAKHLVTGKIAMSRTLPQNGRDFYG